MHTAAAFTERLRTLGWFLRRPGLYPHLTYLLAKKLTPSSYVLNATGPQAANWCAAHAVASELALELMARLPRTDFSVDVCALSGLPGALDADVRRLGGEVIPLRLDGRFPARFVRMLREGDYHVVHSNVMLSSGLMLALAARAEVPVRIAHFHNTHDSRRATLYRRVQRKVMVRLIDRYATDIIACGQGAMEARWGPRWRDDHRCRIVYPGLDPARFEEPVDRELVLTELRIPATAQVIIHVGRQVPVKNHARVLAIFAEFRKINPSSWLVLAGAGRDDLGGEISHAAQALGIEDRVIALGVRHDIPRLLKAADTLLLPSRWEGLPGAVLEACAAGVPVLASDLPGVREIESRLGLIRCLPLTASDVVWAATASMLVDQATREKLRENALEIFRESVFHVDRTVQGLREVWSSSSRVGARATVT
jgi:glycosyltransferase involved in cell wall biosynthesis